MKGQWRALFVGLAVITFAAASMVTWRYLEFARDADVTSSNVESSPEIVVLHIDREYAASARELFVAADTIVVGSFTGEGREYARSSDGTYRHVAADFRVSRVLKGEVQAEVVPVSRTFAAGGADVVEEGAEPIRVGPTYLLALKWAANAYATVGGPQGQFAVENERLRPLSPRLPGGTELHGMTVRDVEALISAAG